MEAYSHPMGERGPDEPREARPPLIEMANGDNLTPKELLAHFSKQLRWVSVGEVARENEALIMEVHFDEEIEDYED